MLQFAGITDISNVKSEEGSFLPSLFPPMEVSKPDFVLQAPLQSQARGRHIALQDEIKYVAWKRTKSDTGGGICHEKIR